MVKVNSPEHIGSTTLNVGTVLELTLIVTVAVVAHCPELGVKTYVVVAVVLIIAGFHVP
jgi:hypothetical protein